MRTIFFTLLTGTCLSLLVGLGLVQDKAKDEHPAPAPAVACCQPTEAQQLRLTLWNRDTQLSERDMADASKHFREMLNGYTGYADQIRKENNWPDTVKFDPRTMQFTQPPPAPIPAAAAPKPPDTKKP